MPQSNAAPHFTPASLLGLTIPQPLLLHADEVIPQPTNRFDRLPFVVGSNDRFWQIFQRAVEGPELAETASLST